MHPVNIYLLSTWLVISPENSVLLSEFLHLLCSSSCLEEAIRPKGEYAKRFSHRLHCWVRNPAKGAFGLKESTIRARIKKCDVVRALNTDHLPLICQPLMNGSRLRLTVTLTGKQCIISPWESVISERHIWVESQDPAFDRLLKAQTDFFKALDSVNLL